ncbi:hypothetical protein [Steroidobacter cummioxidans]|uniref:hypothetical protein n=1 Tax=Steroidobacter cummioxidans TaxID=1803913 RepID=UPI000E31A666|nr:hypothetical protein [Steroidobacter cummioxidans]
MTLRIVVNVLISIGLVVAAVIANRRWCTPPEYADRYCDQCRMLTRHHPKNGCAICAQENTAV